MKLLNVDKKNDVLTSMTQIMDRERKALIKENKKDLDAFQKDDQALYDRLIVDNDKVDSMIKAVKEVRDQKDPVGQVLFEDTLKNGLKITNKTAPFGTILIIYESRPDVTIEAATLAFKANNKILLKGGKEAYHSNVILEKFWHEALEENDLAKDWINLLQLQREETQGFLKNPPMKIDLIVPRGGEGLIKFVKDNASCAVLVSGRGNNFMYISADANWEKTKQVLLNSKTDKTSACNALDNVLLDKNIPDIDKKLKDLQKTLNDSKVNIIVDDKIKKTLTDADSIPGEDSWYEEFLAMKILLAEADGIDDAIERINKYSGGHSTSIMTENPETAERFMEEIDSAAVYHNASTRFTDGGQMGVGAELAISTDKLHHRGPLGLPQLVTNKYYVHGDGQTR